jgi:hypothetical protein
MAMIGRKVGWVVVGLAVGVACGGSQDGQDPVQTPTAGAGGSADAAGADGNPIETYGGVDEPCFPNGTCETGLSCVAETCVPPVGGGGSGGTAGAGNGVAGQPSFGGADDVAEGGAGGEGVVGGIRPMPNPVDSGLPNPAAYDTSKPGIVRDQVTRLMWQREVTETFLFTDILGACNLLTLGGYDDWRVPSRLELMTLVDFTKSEPAIDEEAFPGTQLTGYWSSSPYAAEPETEKWVVKFDFGGTFRGWAGPGGTSELPIRCVRGEPLVPAYEIGADAMAGTVIDHTTGLLWQRSSSDVGPSESAATQACDALDLAGFQDWRVPSMKELQLLVDETSYDPSIDSTLFPAPAGPSPDTMGLWSSSLDVDNGARNWALLRRSGLFLTGLGTSARCIR